MDDSLARYLVGLLPDEEAQRLDEASVADDEFAARLAATEDELFDAYVAGTLPEAYRERFEVVFGATPEGRARIRFAKALAARTPVVRERPAWYPALAAAAVVVLATGVYMSLPAGRGARPANPPVQSGPAAPADPSPPASAPATADPTAPRVFSFLLAAPRRTAGDLPAIPIRDRNQVVEARLEIEGDDFAEYEAILKDAAGVRTLWRSARLKAEGPAARRVVAVRVPGNLLTPRTHVLELRGVPAGGAAQTVAAYPFRIVLE